MIKIDLPKGKTIAHELRRRKREENFAPIDGGTMYAQLNAAGETQRQAIKASDDQTQIDIDAAADELVLKQIMIDCDLCN